MASSATGPLCTIHIGPHKTGSTSIQAFMTENAAVLERHGVLYPALTSRIGTPSPRHGVLREDPDGDGEGAGNWLRLDREALQTGRSVVLSSEFFSETFRDGEALDRFMERLSRRGHRVKILAYVRDQPDWLNSWYVENAKRLGTRLSFERYVEDMDESGRVDPWRIFSAIIDRPGIDFEVVSFERAVNAGLELDFARRVGAPEGADFKPPKRLNASVGARNVYAAQQVMARAGKGARRLKGMLQVANELRRSVEAIRGEPIRFWASDPDLYERIRERYRKGNDRFAQRYFGCDWATLCPGRPRPQSLFDPASAPASERAQIEQAIEVALSAIEELRLGRGAKKAGAPKRSRL